MNRLHVPPFLTFTYQGVERALSAQLRLTQCTFGRALVSFGCGGGMSSAKKEMALECSKRLRFALPRIVC